MSPPILLVVMTSLFRQAATPKPMGDSMRVSSMSYVARTHTICFSPPKLPWIDARESRYDHGRGRMRQGVSKGKEVTHMSESAMRGPNVSFSEMVKRGPRRCHSDPRSGFSPHGFPVQTDVWRTFQLIGQDLGIIVQGVVDLAAWCLASRA